MVTETTSLFERSVELIQKTEREIRALLATAVESGDYEELSKITVCAKGLKALIEKLGSPVPLISAPEGSKGNVGEYPKFFRDGNKLVMVGWSKKGQAEYTHVAPRSALDALLEKLVEACESDEIASTHDLLPLSNPWSGKHFPEYYARTCLRWLRSIGLVKKYGHRGYSIKTDVEYESIIESRWKRLAARG
jgi:hypothetical protein